MLLRNALLVQLCAAVGSTNGTTTLLVVGKEPGFRKVSDAQTRGIRMVSLGDLADGLQQGEGLGGAEDATPSGGAARSPPSATRGTGCCAGSTSMAYSARGAAFAGGRNEDQPG